MKPIYFIIVMIIGIGIVASFSGIIPEPTGAATSDLFTVGLLINDGISIYSYETFARNNQTALNMLQQKMNFEYDEVGGAIVVNAILTPAGTWVMNNNETQWVFMVNDEIPEKNGVKINPNRYYVSPGDNITFAYVSKNI